MANLQALSVGKNIRSGVALLGATAVLAGSGCGSSNDASTSSAGSSTTAVAAATSSATTTTTAAAPAAKPHRKRKRAATQGKTTAAPAKTPVTPTAPAKKHPQASQVTKLPKRTYLSFIDDACKRSRAAMKIPPRPSNPRTRFDWTIVYGMIEAGQLQQVLVGPEPPPAVRPKLDALRMATAGLFAYYQQLQQNGAPPKTERARRAQLAAIVKRQAAADAAARSAGVRACAPRLAS